MIVKRIGTTEELGGWRNGLGPQSFDIAGVCPDLKKVASPVPMTEEMEAFWRIYPKKHLNRYLFARINILGAGEYWGSNLNGDFFPEKALKKYHKTFHQALIYLNHDHDNPDKAIGKVIFATYNDAPYAKRVEIIGAIDRENPRASKTIENLESGKGIKVSMGCKVPFDRCSKCGNIAPTRKEYCEHLKFRMNAIEPDGTLICAMNDDPAFFDASDVSVEADPSSGSMGKIASVVHQMSELLSKKAAEEKEGAIIKPVDKTKDKEPDPAEEAVAENAKDLEEAGGKIIDSDEDLPEDILDRLSDFPMGGIMSTLAGMRIPLKRSEYTFIIIKKASNSADARYAYRQGMEIANEFPAKTAALDLFKDYDPRIEQLMLPYMSKRSMYPSFAASRIANPVRTVKTAAKVVRNQPAGEYYAAYRNSAVDLDPAKLACFLRTRPSLLRTITGEKDLRLIKSAQVMGIWPNVLAARFMMKGAYHV